MARKASPQELTGVFTSQYLEAGKVYTRAELQELFGITAASIRNGIFKPKAFDSVWIFVTEQKTADRTPYDDALTGNLLEMDGQTQGGTDHYLEEHVERGLELVVFHRRNRSEHPRYGFTYEGRFLYQNHEGSNPTKFTLRREASPELSIADIEAELDAQGEFSPDDVIDARKRTLVSIVRRQGQGAFRKTLLKAYSGRCAVTGCSIEVLLEAAHIVPYLGADTNVVSNGLLLRADIHTLFDLGLLWIDPDSLCVGMTENLKASEYSSLEQKPLFLPGILSERPSINALRSHLETLKLV